MHNATFDGKPSEKWFGNFETVSAQVQSTLLVITLGIAEVSPESEWVLLTHTKGTQIGSIQRGFLWVSTLFAFKLCYINDNSFMVYCVLTFSLVNKCMLNNLGSGLALACLSLEWATRISQSSFCIVTPAVSIKCIIQKLHPSTRNFPNDLLVWL